MYVFIFTYIGRGRYGRAGVYVPYISGSFCVSITAAMGIPKLDAGPQKSVVQMKTAISQQVSFSQSLHGHLHPEAPISYLQT